MQPVRIQALQLGCFHGWLSQNFLFTLYAAGLNVLLFIPQRVQTGPHLLQLQLFERRLPGPPPHHPIQRKTESLHVI
jgi:hypothetical protein